jgi:gliding motility-associated-like protein
MRKLFSLVVFLLLAIPLWATHQRAAEITYVKKGGNTYEFTLITYNVPNEAWSQRDSLLMKWGDGFESLAPRVGYEDLGDNTVRSIYRAMHSYSSAGTYSISMEDANRNNGVVNMYNSVNVPMYIESELVISPFLDNYNNSVQLLNAPLDQGCVGRPFYHNPAAYDPDGDSLSYQLVPCRGANGLTVPGYAYPNASSLFEIDPTTGLLRWENPVLQGEYNVAILIEEWRHGVKVGSVVRDMQILINACSNNPPQITTIGDTCVVAGSTLDFLIQASDPDGDEVTLEASGAPFEVSPSATLTPPVDYGMNPTIEFTWNTQCSHIRKTPYQLVVHAKDHASPVQLSNVYAININVIGPEVENLTVELKYNAVDLAWTAYSSCPNVENIVVYRRLGSSTYQPDYCETGVRPGYQLIAKLPRGATSFHDDNGGAEFVQGKEYCYRVLAVFEDGSESRPSDEACVIIPNNQPLMTRVSNDGDDLYGHQVLVGWARPREIDPQFTAPFSYRLIRNLEGVETTVYSGADSTFRDEEVDLAEVQSLYYQVEMRDASQQVVGKSAVAHPIMLSGTGGDRTASLQWNEDVLWEIDSTEVFRKYDTVFKRIATVDVMEYVDTKVDNEVEYQYYVRTYGHYPIPGLPKPLVNYSAVITVKPTEHENPDPNMPVYELPNVFTPNGDTYNEVFTPRSITPDLIVKVDMHIFNRWGRFVFETKDIYINWDGRASGTGLPCASGTYFYVCDVEMITPDGPVTKRLQGSVMIVR